MGEAQRQQARTRKAHTARSPPKPGPSWSHPPGRSGGSPMAINHHLTVTLDAEQTPAFRSALWQARALHAAHFVAGFAGGVVAWLLLG